jgi:enoyl-CoA hydratase
MENYGVRLEYRGNIAVVTLDRPARRNAFNEKMWDDFERAAAALGAKPPRAVVVTGAGGKAFCAGFDVNPDNPQIERLIGAVNEHSRPPVEALLGRIRAAVDRLVFLPVPVIAAINGLAYGGGAELAVRCDLRVADPDAVICFSELKLGLMPDWGGGASLARLAGPARAADLILTARKVSADEALRLGIVNRISVPGGALAEALELAGTIARNGPRAARHALQVIRRAADMPLNEALELETAQAVELTASGECIHGITAFLLKKEPEFPDL